MHELAHIWLGESALSDIDVESIETYRIERWCNQVAAEVLVPMDEFRSVFNPQANLIEELDRLAAMFKVSTLMLLVRALEAGYMSRDDFNRAFEGEQARVMSFERTVAGGGNSYINRLSYVGRRFASAIVGSTLEGETLYRDAFRLLGVQSQKTFNGLAERLDFT